MSETWEAQGAAFEPKPAANDGVTAGTLLRRAREAAGLHVAALAVSLKVPVRKLEALEDDRWDVLNDAVFVRALASSVCRSLKIDPQPVLERLPQPAAPRLRNDDDAIGTPYRAPSDGAPPSWLDHVTKPVFLAVFALLLGALVLILLPSVQTEDKARGTAGQDASSNANTAALTPAIVASHVVENVAPTLPAAPAEAPAATPGLAGATTATASALAAPVALPGATASAAVTAPVAATAASGIVMFRARGPSWVEVKDAKGVIAMRKLLQSGEWTGVSGALPLQVTVGRADQTEVQVRGKPFDLGAVAKDNVARFEVN